MSTCNFSLPSTSKHYCIGLEHDMEYWEYQDIIDNLGSDLEAMGGSLCDDWSDRDTRRVARFSIDYFDRDYKQWDYAYLYVVVESGYYQGAMFDIDDSDIENYEVCKSTLAKVERLKRRIEKVLEANSETKLHRVGVFSNGEAIYERA